MIRKDIFLTAMFILAIASASFAQNGTIQGTVIDGATNEPIPFATVVVKEITKGGNTDIDGNFTIKVDPGIYTVEVNYLGYEDAVKTEIEVNASRPTEVNFTIQPSNIEIDEVVVKADLFQTKKESPVSLRSIGVSEIRRNPGANRDISRVVQSLPGVTSTAGFRNDLIIRGGAPNENSFFLDGVEVPNINHYATQGAGGGPAGLINVNFIREVDFYSGAFPANRGDGISSVFDFKQRDGRSDRWGGIATISGTDAGILLEGPIGDHTTVLASARRSYLSFLFKLIGLPFLPTYNDFQIKTKTKIGKNHEISFIGLGAYDAFSLNLDAGVDEASVYLLENLPVTPQWNYTNGLVYKNYLSNGFRQLVISRNMLNNRSYKYRNNDESDPENLILDFTSQEIENKVRYEEQHNFQGWKLTYGLGYQYVKFNNQTFSRIFTLQGPMELEFNSELDFSKYSAFSQVSKSFFNDKLSLSAGFRMDGASYSDDMSNPLDQFSPRLSASYQILDWMSINANIGRYFQLPPYTVMGYEEDDILVNKQNNIQYIQADHFVAGLEFKTSSASRITLEGYYKQYDYYPFLVRDSVSLANVGGDFGVVGNEPAISSGEGQTYGLEVLYQQKLFKGFYGIVAYTLGWSQFDNAFGELVPSSWDARHIVNLTFGKKFGKGWEVGTAIRYQSGLPRTPFDEDSDLASSWFVNNGPFLDYSQVNSLRNEGTFGMDVRIDKKWYIKNVSFNVYVDVENVTASSTSSTQLILDRPVDEDGKPVGDAVIVNPGDPFQAQRVRLKEIDASFGAVLPSIGVQIDF